MSEQVNNHQQEVPVDVVVSVVSVGERLRQAREARGMQLDDIAQMLKLGFRQVEALESGNWQGLPGHTFIRGFVRNYARLVQLDPQSLMVELDRVLERPVDNLHTQHEAPTAMPQAGARVSGRDRQFLLVGAGMLLLAALAYFLMPSDLSDWRDKAQGMLDSLAHKEAAVPVSEGGESSAGSQPAANEPVFPPGENQQQVMYPQALNPADAAAPNSASSVVAPAPTQPSVAPAPSQLPVATVPPATQPVTASEPSSTAPQLKFVVDKESWVEVRDRDNKVIFSQSLTAGTEQALSGQGPLTLKIGYAPGVRLFWRGQAVDLVPHTKGDVARLVME